MAALFSGEHSFAQVKHLGKELRKKSTKVMPDISNS